MKKVDIGAVTSEEGLVTSVGGQTGAVTLESLNLDQVDNTRDLDKPISLAVQAALDLKADVGSGGGGEGGGGSSDPWANYPIGPLIAIDDGLDGLAVPPTDQAYKYIELTAGLTEEGGYNEGLLGEETLTGSSPEVTATAEIILEESPFFGKTVHLINTERMFLRAGDAGIIQNSQNKAHTHTGTALSAGAHTHTVSISMASGAGNGGSVNGANGNSKTTSSSGDHTHTLSINSSGGEEARPRNIGVRYFRRIL